MPRRGHWPQHIATQESEHSALAGVTYKAPAGVAYARDKFASLTRQRRRARLRANAFDDLRKQFCGIGPSGEFRWPENMPRRIGRQIARARASFLFKTTQPIIFA